MDKKRPQGRETFTTGQSSGVHKRGDGLNTGPVGSGSNFSAGSSGSNGSGGQRTTRSGKGGLLPIIIAAIIALGGGGGLLGNFLGGSDSGDVGYYDTNSYNNDYNSSYNDSYQTSQSSQSTQSGQSGNIFTQSNTTDQSAAQSNTTTQNETTQSAPAAQNSTAAVSDGVRDRYTTILGNGQDTVTIMVYMCGTDLESNASMATRDLLEMTKATWGDNMHVIVYTGGCTRWQNQIVSANVNQIYEVVNGGLRALVENDGQKSMTNPDTLAAFIQWCGQNYPADRNELILWDHGGGSVSGYGYDEKFKSSGSMSLAGISKALKNAGMKFDFIGFDACLMATLETGLMLDEFADYMVASEETEPGIGWYYTNWLTGLGKNTSLPTEQVGKSIVDDFVSTCASQCAGQSATLSVIDLAELSASTPAALKSFSQSLSSMITNNNYQQISSARNSSREFARSSAIDQIDLIDFANKLGTGEGKELVSSLQKAVKYNRTSSNMTNSYGVSIYFPYRKTSTVNSAISTYNAIGMDESYTQAIREFAGLEVSGQAATGGTGMSSSIPSLLEALMGGSAYESGSSSSSYGGADMISGLLEAFMGGGYESSGLGSAASSFLFGRSMSQEDTMAYITDNFFDAGALTWTQNGAGETVISLPDDQWDLIEDIDLNMYYDDGEGYIDLGIDNVFDWDDDGNLLAPDSRTWLSVNGQPVAYYREYTSDTETRGYIPVMLNGIRAELIVVFDEENPYGTITGARYVYVDGQTETVAKSLESLNVGDELEFICDYYTYDGDYQNSYYLGEPMTVTENMVLSNEDVGEGAVRVTFRFTDLYQQHYWTPALIG